MKIWKKLVLVMAFAVMPAVVEATTVRTYDENTQQANTVDFTATGSHFTSDQLAARIADAFDQDAGGVLNGSLLGRSYLFGRSQSKTFILFSTDFGIGRLGSSVTAISGDFAFGPSSIGDFRTTSFRMGITDGEFRERVTAIGVTTLSADNRDYGLVTATAFLASGGVLTASRNISEGAGLGDTFFGFQAPPRDHITRLVMNYNGPDVGDRRLWFDDIGFITSAYVPEPSAAVILLGFIAVGATQRPTAGRRA